MTQISLCDKILDSPLGEIAIVAIVRYNDGILVTHKVDEFGRIPGLKLEDWTAQNQDQR